MRLTHSWILVCLITAGVFAGDEWTIIAHPDCPLESLSEIELRKIYYGKLTECRDGTPLVPLLQKNEKENDRFVSERLGRTSQQFTSFWKQSVFTGEGIPPKKVDGNAEMLEYVGETPGAIGYLHNCDPTAKVKVIEVE